MCDLACAIINQSVLYLGILIAPLFTLGIILYISKKLELHGIISLIFIIIDMLFCWLFGLTPLYIAITVSVVATFSQFQNRLRGQKRNETE